RRHPVIHVPGVAVYHRIHDRQGSRCARHTDEVALLWAYFLDRMTEDELRTHAASAAELVARLRRTPVVVHSPILRDLAGRLVHAETTSATVNVLVVGAPGFGVLESCHRHVREAGPHVERIVIMPIQDSDVAGMAVSWAD